MNVDDCSNRLRPDFACILLVSQQTITSMIRLRLDKIENKIKPSDELIVFWLNSTSKLGQKVSLIASTVTAICSSWESRIRELMRNRARMDVWLSILGKGQDKHKMQLILAWDQISLHDLYAVSAHIYVLTCNR